MDTSQFITYLRRKLGDSYTREMLREEVNAVQNEILALPGTNRMRSKGDVFLTTVDGTFEYTLDPSVRKVSRVFIRESADGNYVDPMGYPGNGFAATRTVKLGTNTYVESELQFNTDESLRYGDPVILYFPTDQSLGDSTTRYRIEQYVWPNQITSENVPLSLPDTILTTAVYYAVKKRMEEAGYGADIYNEPQFKATLGAWLSHDATEAQQIRPTRRPRF